MMTPCQTMLLRPRSSHTLRPRLLAALRHAGSFGRCSGSSCFAWLLLAVCILVVSGGTSAMPATTVEGHETTAEDLGAMLDAREGAVVTLVAGKTRLAVHRAVLAARSPVFSAMFAHDPLEASRQEFVIPDVEGSDLRKLVAVLYSGRNPQLPGMTPQLLEAATKYGVSVLTEAFEQQLVRQLTVDNVAANAVLAVTHNYTTLRKAAVNFIRAHVVQVVATPGWAEAVHSYPGAVVEFMSLLAEPATETRSLSGDEKGRRLLQAAEDGAVGEVRALLAAGADIGARDGDDMTALHKAARRGLVEVAQCLLQAGAEVDAKNREQWTPLHHAATSGHAAVVRLLLAASADPNARESLWLTPLHWAAYYGHAEAATALLESGPDVEARSYGGKTPLDFARQMNNQPVIEILEMYMSNKHL